MTSSDFYLVMLSTEKVSDMFHKLLTKKHSDMIHKLSTIKVGYISQVINWKTESHTFQKLSAEKSLRYVLKVFNWRMFHKLSNEECFTSYQLKKSDMFNKLLIGKVCHVQHVTSWKSLLHVYIHVSPVINWKSLICWASINWKKSDMLHNSLPRIIWFA